MPQTGKNKNIEPRIKITGSYKKRVYHCSDFRGVTDLKKGDNGGFARTAFDFLVWMSGIDAM